MLTYVLINLLLSALLLIILLLDRSDPKMGPAYKNPLTYIFVLCTLPVINVVALLLLIYAPHN